MELLSYLFWVSILLSSYCRGNDLEYDGQVNLRLEHALDDTPTPVYSHRGDIYIKSLHYGIARIEELPLTTQQVKLLKSVAADNGNYKLKAIITSSEGKENYFTTFVKTCALIESHMNNTVSIYLDHNGNVIAVVMAVPKICAGSQVEDNHLMHFDTIIEVRHMEAGPVPDTATYIQKLEKEREAKERGEVKDNRSFLAKYWMYIVPVVIFMLLPSATNTDSGGAAQR